MKILFDQNISFRISKQLQDLYPGCCHVSDCGMKDKEDSEIWKYAKDNNFAIVSFDSDFYEISLINGHPPKIIWVRTGNLSTNDLAKLLENKSSEIIAFLTNVDEIGIACLELEALNI